MATTYSVVGIDLSLTSTGIAEVVSTANGMHLLTDTVTSSGRRDAALVDRHARLTGLASAVLERVGANAELAVVEMPLANFKGGSAIDRHALFWLVVGPIIRREIPVATVDPSSLKKAIAGRGGADKVEVALALARMWPDADLGNNDSTDAAALAHLGAVRLGWAVPTLERHRTVKAAWPEFGLPESGAVA